MERHQSVESMGQVAPWATIIPDVTDPSPDNKEPQGLFWQFYSSLYTFAYGNNTLTTRNYETLDDAVKAKDLLGATKLFMTQHATINLTPEQREFLRETWACDAVELEKTDSKRRVQLPYQEGALDAFLYVLQNTTSIYEFQIHSYKKKESHIMKALEAFCTVETVGALSLDGSDIITDNIAKTLVKVLTHNKGLRKLDASWNMSNTLPYITAAMRENTTLEELLIWRFPPYTQEQEAKHPSLKAEDLIAFAQMLETNTTLKHLSLKGANIPDNVAAALAIAFAKNNSLESIELSECRISAEGLQLLASVWRSKRDLGALKKISLSGNDPNGAYYLSELENQHPNLVIYYDTGRRCCGQRQYQPLDKPGARLNRSMK